MDSLFTHQYREHRFNCFIRNDGSRLFDYIGAENVMKIFTIIDIRHLLGARSNGGSVFNPSEFAIHDTHSTIDLSTISLRHPSLQRSSIIDH